MALLSLFLVFSILVAATLWKRFTRPPYKRLPPGLKKLPGPKGYPILGSVPDVPDKNSYIKFAEWGKEYGPIYQVNLAGSNHVWISSDAIAHDLLSKKGAIYSDRPHIPALIDDNRTAGQYLPLSSKNGAWARQRKFATAIMRESESAKFHHYPELEAKRMLAELMEQPSQYNHALESFISRVTCRLAWGHSEAYDELKQRARELLIGVSPTGAMGNKLPFLMSLPDWLSPPKAWERRRAKTESRFFETMQNDVERDIKEKRAPQSWMRTFLESRGSWGFKYDLEGAYAVGMHSIAGALTIAAPMQTFCLAMCHYPQYLPMLQEELDRVCGDRLPRSEDRESLPFLRAVIRECLRWRPPVPTGIPHYLIQDDSYAGYHIPKGSVMHPLEWAISRDPAMFPDPESFNPLRWIQPEFPTYREPLTQYPTVINCTQFGYGRRVCTGQGVADEDMLIGIGSIAWLFNIAKKKEGDDESCGDSGYDSQSEVEELNEKDTLHRHRADATISPEELKTVMETSEQAVVEEKSVELLYPGAWPVAARAEDEAHTKKQLRMKPKKKAQNIDPTLDFTTLLIAKPVPFEFSLTVRSRQRAEKVRGLFEEELEKGSYASSRNYWGENQGKGKDLGWGKV